MTDTTTERVGRYQLLETLGSGPTGTVSRAKVFGVAGFERQFAIKRFIPEVSATGPAAQALSAAARAYGNLEHPRIARMTEFGVSQGTTFTAVEYVAGIDALRLVTEARLAGATLAPGGALALVSQAARAVGYAHGRGISHLGLAPTNVIVTADGDVKITDFAVLAATLPPRPVDQPRLAQRIGYLAPEQIAGEATSAATDVFALGVLAYELITARRAFEGDTPTRIAQAVITGPPAEPPLPRPIIRVLQRCLARSPFERFPDARALADALDAALRVAPVPGSRKDIGMVVRELVDRLAQLRDGQMSGMLALDVGTGPRPKSEPNDFLSQLALSDTDLDEPTNRPLPRAETDLSVPLAPSGLVAGASATQPDLPRPITTVTGLPPPPIPVPQGVAAPPPMPAIPIPGASTTLHGDTRERAAATPSTSAMTVPTIRPRNQSGASKSAPRMRAATPPPATPLDAAIAAAVPAFPDDDPAAGSGPAALPEPPEVTIIPGRAETPPPVPERRDATPMPSRKTPPPMPAARGEHRTASPPPALFAPSPAGEQVIAEATDRARTLLDARHDADSDVRPTASSVAVLADDGSRDMPTSDMPPMLVERLNEAARAHSDEIAAVAAAATEETAHNALAAIDDLARERAQTGSAPIELSVPGGPGVEAPVASSVRIATRVPTPFPVPTEAPQRRRSRAPWLILALIVIAGGGAAAAWQLGLLDLGGDEAVHGGNDVVGSASGAVASPVASVDASVAAVDAPVVATTTVDAVAPARIDAALVAMVADAGARGIDAAAAGSSAAGSGSAVPAVATIQSAPGNDLAIRTTPTGARAFLDGSDAGPTPVSRPGSADRHTLVAYALGYDLYVGKVDGRGTFDIALEKAPAFTGDAGIKVIHCKDKDRYYVYVDGKPTGQTCPTDIRINCSVGAHTVEVYDAQTDKRRSWNITVTDTRLSFRVRVDDSP